MQELETARLYLRQFTPDDLDDLYRIYSDPEIMKYVGKGARTREETETALYDILASWKQNNFGMWVLANKINNQFIGECGLIFLEQTPEVELGYILDKYYWNQGLAAEASLASLQYGFDVLKLEKIVAVAHPENIASQRVMQKVGMKYEKNARYYDSDVVYYSISRSDYLRFEI